MFTPRGRDDQCDEIEKKIVFFQIVKKFSHCTKRLNFYSTGNGGTVFFFNFLCVHWKFWVAEFIIKSVF